MSSTTPACTNSSYSPRAAAVTDAALKGAHSYYFMIALCEGTIPPRLTPLQFVDDPQQRVDVAERIMCPDVQNQATIDRGRDVLQEAIMVGFRVSRDAHRLVSEVKQAITQALTLDEVLNLEARLHEPHPGAQENKAESFLCMIAAMDHTLDSTTALESWVTANIIPIIDMTAHTAAARYVLSPYMDLAPVPATFEKENKTHAPNFASSSPSASSMASVSLPRPVLASVHDPAIDAQINGALQSNGAWPSLSALSGWFF
ncbi:uncharacterized protein SCHCODRAFT_02750908 [Schizophyllum commune H4-8]|uniref:Uncharacterized protein n=1 Tax=Schizophyllum commune (strain H4-8 / FGSC 9210) TaxID=578458 RepID=D8QBW2_SCHCM|nr:uncharacterized protein SCHCODRAFT_02750908 [Schizophyllum commune H4-8]KAI5889339.1 hypothetical protein SCHCODRAFT_02750908 [Schizophyllum commune H4-8]